MSRRSRPRSAPKCVRFSRSVPSQVSDGSMSTPSSTSRRSIACSIVSLRRWRLSGSPMAAYRGLVVDVVDARPAVRPEGDEPGVLVRQHAGDEVVDLLPVRDAGEGRVLAADEDAGVQHHRHEEARLAIREPERRNRVDAVGLYLRDVLLGWQLNVH